MDHGSHENGRDVDIRYLRNNQTEGPVSIGETGLFSRALSQELIDLFLLYEDEITLIYVGDTQFTGSRLDFSEQNGHQDHFHVRIIDPDGNN